MDFAVTKTAASQIPAKWEEKTSESHNAHIFYLFIYGCFYLFIFDHTTLQCLCHI